MHKQTPHKAWKTQTNKNLRKIFSSPHPPSIFLVWIFSHDLRNSHSLWFIRYDSVMCSNSRARQVHTQGISESDDALLVQVGSAGVVGEDHGQVRPPVSPSLVHHILQTPGQLLQSHWDAEYLQPVVWDTEHFQPVFLFYINACGVPHLEMSSMRCTMTTT